MLGAVIRNGNNTLVAELPTGTMDLQAKLSSIGITQTADISISRRRSSSSWSTTVWSGAAAGAPAGRPLCV